MKRTAIGRFLIWFVKAPERLSELKTWTTMKLVLFCVFLAFALALPILALSVGLALNRNVAYTSVIMGKNLAAIMAGTNWDRHQFPELASLPPHEWHFLNLWSWIEAYFMLIPLGFILLLFVVGETRRLVECFTPASRR